MFNQYIRSAKEQEARAELSDALDNYRAALQIFSDHATLNKKVCSLMRKLAISDSEEKGMMCPQTLVEPEDLPADPLSSIVGSLTTASSATRHCELQHASSKGIALDLPGGFHLDESIACRLFAHQREGVRWLWSLHSSQIGDGRASISGGCLADDSKCWLEQLPLFCKSSMCTFASFSL